MIMDCNDIGTADDVLERFSDFDPQTVKIQRRWYLQFTDDNQNIEGGIGGNGGGGVQSQLEMWEHAMYLSLSLFLQCMIDFCCIVQRFGEFDHPYVQNQLPFISGNFQIYGQYSFNGDGFLDQTKFTIL